MPDWPAITEPELLARLGLTDDDFRTTIAAAVRQMPAREPDAAIIERAKGYPWWRPEHSYVLTDGAVQPLEGATPEERAPLLRHFLADQGPQSRVRVLAIGSNAAPETLTQKFAHFPDEEDRTVLVIAGRLQDFDVGVAAQPTLYGSMPATLFESPGTAVRAAVLLVTPTQFTQLAWSELTYRLGWLATTFAADQPEFDMQGALVFISRFGTFCIDGAPVALDFIPANDRNAPTLTQERFLDAAAELAFGPGGRADRLIRAIFADAGEAFRVAAPIREASLPFRSDRFTPLPTGA